MTILIITYLAANMQRKHIAVPKDYQLVVSGNIKERDRILDYGSRTFEIADTEDIGSPIGELIIVRKRPENHDDADSLEGVLFTGLNYTVEISEDTDKRDVSFMYKDKLRHIDWIPSEEMNFTEPEKEV